jgi:hypothetical protein
MEWDRFWGFREKSAIWVIIVRRRIGRGGCIIKAIRIGDHMNDDKVEDPFGRLLQFLDELEEVHIYYDLKHSRDSILVRVDVPTGMWEIEFFEDGTLEVELFPREKGVEAVPEEWLKHFIERNRD